MRLLARSDSHMKLIIFIIYSLKVCKKEGTRNTKVSIANVYFLKALKIITQVKCEVIEETSQGASDAKCQDLRFKVLHVECRSLSGNVGSEPPPPMKYSIVEIQHLAVSIIAQKKLSYHQHHVSLRFVSSFDLRFEPAATCVYLR